MAEVYFYREKKERNYTVLDNTFLKDPNLSAKAKGIMAYLLMLPEDWKIYIKELVNNFADGETSIRSGIKELQEHGYIKVEKIRNEKGQFIATIYHIIEQPEIENPDVENPDLENPNVDESDLENQALLNTNNTKYLNKQNTKNNNFNKLKDENLKNEISVFKNGEKKEINSLEITEKQSLQKNPGGGTLQAEVIKTKKTKKDYGDPEINELLQIIADYNDGVIDGTKKEQRQYGKLLLNKIKKVKAVSSSQYRWQDWFRMLLSIVSKNEYHNHKITGPKKIFYELATLIQVARQEYLRKEKEKIPSFNRDGQDDGYTF